MQIVFDPVVGREEPNLAQLAELLQRCAPHGGGYELSSPVGANVAHIGVVESNIHIVAQAVAWRRPLTDLAVRLDKLAMLAQMSVSSIHQHFKSVTAMSPLQFQKLLRLPEHQAVASRELPDAY